jgi:mannose-6-phosphate isomerase class I
MRMLRSTAEELSRRVIKPLKNNFVERPWGGTSIREFKSLCAIPDQRAITGAGIGECFEISAYDTDSEAAAFPSLIRLEDGSVHALPAILEQHGDLILGEDFVERFGRRFPLLPKILDIAELLSVQGHPMGNTEAYVILRADEGATIRLGFNQDVDAARLEREVSSARAKQAALLDTLTPSVSQFRLHSVLKPWFANRRRPVDALLPMLSRFGRSAVASRTMADLVLDLKESFWFVLDLMNEIPVRPGQVIHNANPARLVAAGRSPRAEVHALGNPDGKEILALEVRRPGATLRLWDNVRYPMRDIETRRALEVLSLRRTEPAEFIVEARARRPGVKESIVSEPFRLEHLKPSRSLSVFVTAESTHCLHALAGRMRISNSSGQTIGVLEHGESAIIPVGVGAYEVHAEDEDNEALKVSLR